MVIRKYILTCKRRLSWHFPFICLTCHIEFIRTLNIHVSGVLLSPFLSHITSEMDTIIEILSLVLYGVSQILIREQIIRQNVLIHWVNKAQRASRCKASETYSHFRKIEYKKCEQRARILFEWRHKCFRMPQLYYTVQKRESILCVICVYVYRYVWLAVAEPRCPKLWWALTEAAIFLENVSQSYIWMCC